METGDFVILKDSDQTGTVNKVLSPKKIEVALDNGFILQLATSKVELTEKPEETIEEKKSYALKIPPHKVDLHIEHLVNDHTHLSNSEKVQLQLETFEIALSRAIAAGMIEITFVHGIGQGVLRKEIHTILRKTKQIKSFCDAQFDRGATIVKIY